MIKIKMESASRIDDPHRSGMGCLRPIEYPVLIHSGDPASFWQKPDENNERWLELKTRSVATDMASKPVFEQVIEEQHNIFRKHPKTTFIAAHLYGMVSQ